MITTIVATRINRMSDELILSIN